MVTAGDSVNRAPDGPVCRVATGTVFGLLSLWLVVNIANGAGLVNDARIYWAAGHAAVTGTNPWMAEARGWHFGAFPPTALLFAPAGLLPEPLFLTLWMAATIAAAVWIVRLLGLEPLWLLYPPLVFGVALGNPIVLSMALVLAGHELVGTLLRPQQAIPALVRRPRIILPLAAIGVVSLLVFPGWIGEAAAVAARHADESGPPLNAWGSLWILPSIIALAVVARTRLELAAWLLPAVVFPGSGLYSAMAFMVTRQRGSALMAALPIPGAMPLAALMVAISGRRPPRR